MVVNPVHLLQELAACRVYEIFSQVFPEVDFAHGANVYGLNKKALYRCRLCGCLRPLKCKGKRLRSLLFCVIRKLLGNIDRNNQVKKQILVYFRMYFKIRKWLDKSNHWIKVSSHLMFSLM